jgi:hypothetical protein
MVSAPMPHSRISCSFSHNMWPKTKIEQQRRAADPPNCGADGNLGENPRGKVVAWRTFEGLVEVDGVLAWVGGRRRQGEARHRRQSLRVRGARCPRCIRFDSIWSARGRGGEISEMWVQFGARFALKGMRTTHGSGELAWTASSRPGRLFGRFNGRHGTDLTGLPFAN